MARCRWCDQSGLFLKTDKEGLCKTCSPKVLATIEGHCNVIYETMHLIERAPSDAERVAHCDRLLESVNALLAYDEKGLTTCSPPPRLVLEEYRGFRAGWAR